MKRHAGSNAREGFSDMLVCLHLGTDVADTMAVGDRLKAWLEIFQRRFAARVVLGMAGFAPLAPDVLAPWIRNGLLAQSICSGHDDLTLNDLVAAAVRSRAQHACFIDVRHLLSDMAGTIRYLVECMQRTGTAYIDDGAHKLYVPVTQLEQLLQLEFCGTWASRLRDIYQRCRHSSVTDHLEVMPIGDRDESGGRSAGPRHCFATATGVERLGGFAKFRALPLYIGGVQVSAFDRYWLLDISGSALVDISCAAPTVQRMPAIWDAESIEAPVVFDICPAPYAFDSSADGDPTVCINVPRQVVIGRRCTPLEGGGGPCNDQDVVFIASNYNKQGYLHASLYSLVMQTHPRVRVEFVDDVSSDDSLAWAHSFCALLNLPEGLITLRENRVNRGTYWIRNGVTARESRLETVLFVNDSDDYSTALRATLQLAALEARKESLGCFFDIVRVAPTWAPLLLKGEVERYGTASLCYKPELVIRVGYFQNIKKNADTEFIERVRRFEGPDALPWLRYPVLYQPFDGDNLTTDIYAIQQGGSRIQVKEGMRSLHSAIFRKEHGQIRRGELVARFGFPLSTLTGEYAELGDEFLVDGYRAVDDCIVMLTTVHEVAEAAAWLKCGVCVLYRDIDQNWIVRGGGGQLTSNQGLAEALVGFVRSHAPHSYLVLRAVLSSSGTEGLGAHSVLAALTGPWLYRSKAEGDRWAYAGNGDRMDPKSALGLLSEQWPALQGGASFDGTPVLIHTSSFDDE